jgi:hypothetical protein
VTYGRLIIVGTIVNTTCTSRCNSKARGLKTGQTYISWSLKVCRQASHAMQAEAAPHQHRQQEGSGCGSRCQHRCTRVSQQVMVLIDRQSHGGMTHVDMWSAPVK